MNEDVVRKDKRVSFSYSILNAVGEVVEHNDLPITYVHGYETEIFPQVIEALEGCKPGDEVCVELSPEEAFGDHDPSLKFTDDIENVPPEVHYVGAEIEAQNEQGEIRQFRVIHIEDGKITVDANHPLAGQTITFRVTVREVRDPAVGEMAGEHPACVH